MIQVILGDSPIILEQFLNVSLAIPRWLSWFFEWFLNDALDSQAILKWFSWFSSDSNDSQVILEWFSINSCMILGDFQVILMSIMWFSNDSGMILEWFWSDLQDSQVIPDDSWVIPKRFLSDSWLFSWFSSDKWLSWILNDSCDSWTILEWPSSGGGRKPICAHFQMMLQKWWMRKV